MDLHGGNIYKLKRDSNKTVIDYSSNINPLGVPESFKKAVIDNFDELEKYPDIDYVDLRKAIADYNNCNLENVIVGNGATEVLFLYMKNISAKKILIVAPTFAEYERGAKSANKEITFFPYEDDFSLDIDKLLNHITDKDVVVICNPNNPTGKFQNLEKIKYLADSLESLNKFLFIDEAFIEFIDEWKDKTALHLKNKNIFILRALTKFFALPGVRLGYGLSYDLELLEKINSTREPWSVNGVAEIAGKTMLLDEKYISDTEFWIKDEKRWFFNELSTINNIEVHETETNFILVKSLSKTAKEIQNEMISEGVLIRNASNFKFLSDKFFRLAIKDRERNTFVLNALKKVIE